MGGSAPGESEARFLGEIRPGEARALVAESTDAGLSLVREHAEATGCVTAMHRWRRAPDVHGVVEEAISALAEAARVLWPDWYGRGSRGPAVNASWLKAAVADVEASRAPRSRGFALGVTARQLGLALSPTGPMIAMALDDLAASPERLRAFASAATWVAREAAARVVVVLPEALAAHAALDAVTYRAHRAPPGPAPAPPVATTVWPIVGRPHPASPGEQIIARRLARDPELGGLFRFNERVETVRGTEPRVDLVWRDGGVVVEIDGWGHTLARSYRGDRERDYELLVSGYLVLRLPHEVVLEDPELAVEKIRDVVHYRQKGGP